MEKHGKASCTKRAKHIQICHFCITDSVKSRDVSTQHLPSTEMIRDCFSNPLARSPFKKLCNLILGTDKRDTKSCKEACVSATSAKQQKELNVLNKRPQVNGKQATSNSGEKCVGSASVNRTGRQTRFQTPVTKLKNKHKGDPSQWSSFLLCLANESDRVTISDFSR